MVDVSFKGTGQVSLVPPFQSKDLPDYQPAVWPVPVRHRAIFLSDMHLGARMCRPYLILAFLDAHQAETVYLVGDIVDNWLPMSNKWPVSHHQVVRRLLDLPQTGSRVVYLPGNHDSFFRAYAGSVFGDIEVALETIHVTASGQRLLVTHGDQCDVFSRRAPIMARVGSLIDTGARALDAAQRAGSRAVGLPQWSGITRQIARANALIRSYDRFEERLCGLAAGQGLDGIVCGHFHQPALHERHGPIYANCGDWAEHGTGLVEGFDGRLRLLSVGQTANPKFATTPTDAAADTYSVEV